MFIENKKKILKELMRSLQIHLIFIQHTNNDNTKRSILVNSKKHVWVRESQRHNLAVMLCNNLI